jgi:group I intron endonuclease
MLLKPARSSKAPRPQWPPSKSAQVPLPPRRYNLSDKKYAAPIPRRSGIYRIVCKVTGQFYVGSALDLRDRARGHWSALRRRKHSNKYLQRAWNRHREINFEFKVLELVKPSCLLATEQSWLNSTHCVDRRIGFNILPRALSPSSLVVQTRKGFFDPCGRPVTIKNLHKFCRQKRLGFTSMMRLYQGNSKLKSYRGWTHTNSVRIRDYVKTYEGFIKPNGRHAGKITNLHAFSRRHGLTASHMIAVAHGRIVSHRGWTHRDGRKALTPKRHSGFIRPDGRPTVIINLAGFCRENGLSVVHMHNLKSGIRKFHKGWTWREE